MEFDLVIRSPAAVLEGVGLVECTIGICGERIAAILAPEERVTAHDEIDGRHLIVLPGVIDAHVHFGLGSENDFRTESQAAVRGGVTLVLNYVMDARSYFEAGEEDRRRGEADSVIDFGLHFVLMNELHLDEAERYVREFGVSSFKYFTNFKGSEGAYLGVEGTDTGFFLALCKRLGAIPESVLAVHTENIEVVWRLAEELKAAGRDGLPAWTESRPGLAEALDMRVALALGEETGCRLYIPHLSSAAGLDAYRKRASSNEVWLETCPHYLTHTADSELGSLVKVNPPVRTREDVDALWAAIIDGTIAVVGSDHNSRPRARKEGSIWSASAGFPGVSTLLPVMLSEGYWKRGLSIERIASLLSTTPARIFGLYPRKGSIAPGFDADLTIVDLDAEHEVAHQEFGSHADYSIYDGWRLRGRAVATIVRGVPVMREGEILVEPGQGQFVSRPAQSDRPVTSRLAGAKESSLG